MPNRTRTRRTFLTRLAAAAALAAAEKYIAAAPPRTVNPRTFGATGDGLTPDTAALQRAIDSVAAAGGGIVSLTPGSYVTGTLLLRSNVTLHLEAGATLLGSLNPADYRLVEPFTDGVGTPRGYALLACVDAHAVALTGTGVLDGRGTALQAAAGAASKSPAARPFLTLWVRSTGITVSDVQLRNSSAWTMHLFQCQDVAVTGLTIHSTGLANNDGIDIDSSARVRIDRCTITSDDDAICLKTTSALPCRDITVTACTLTTRCAAIKLGTESYGDFSNLHVADCHVVRANLGAVKLLSVDGAHIANVLVERLTVDEADTPIFLRLGARGRTYRTGDTTLAPGSLSAVTLRDITVARAHRVGILLSGLPGHTIDGVTLDRITITLAGDAAAAATPAVPLSEPAELPAAYPEVRMFGTTLPAYGLYGRHLRSLRTSAVAIKPAPGDQRPQTILSDADKLPMLPPPQPTGSPTSYHKDIMKPASTLLLLLAAASSFLLAQPPKPAVPTAAKRPTPGAAARPTCVKLPDLSPKIPALPASAPCAKPLYTITTVPSSRLEYVSPMENAGLKESLGLEPSSFTLAYVDTKVGTGPLATPHKWYTINYTGYLADGTKFDSSFDHTPAEPISIPYGQHQVIPGWDTGFDGMHVGGKRRLFIPYQLAYGPNGRQPTIPPRAELIFDVELVAQSDTEPKPPTPPTPPPAATGLGAPAAPATPSPATPAAPTPTTPPVTPPSATPPPVKPQS